MSKTIVACIELTREAATDLHRELAEQLGIVKILPRVANAPEKLDYKAKVERVTDALAGGGRTYGELLAITGLDTNGLYGVLCRNASRTMFRKVGKLWQLS